MAEAVKAKYGGNFSAVSGFSFFGGNVNGDLKQGGNCGAELHVFGTRTNGKPPFRWLTLYMYAKVRIPHRSAPNRRKRDSTKETPKLADLRRLMVDPNLRFQVANAMVNALPPIPDGTCISDIATDMADVILSTAAELVPRSKRPRGAHGWCA